MNTEDIRRNLAGALLLMVSTDGTEGIKLVTNAIDELIQRRINEALNPQPEPPAPPAFAVGTLVHARYWRDTPGEVIEVSEDTGRVRVKFNGANGEVIHWRDAHELEPLPSDPGAPAGALPAGVTREETDTHIEYTLALPQSQLKTVGVTFNKETQANAIGVFQANLLMGSVKLESSERKALIAMLQAIDAEIETNNGLH